MLLVDLRRPALGRGGPSLAARPCRELGRVWPAAAGDAGLLELGDILGGDAVSAGASGAGLRQGVVGLGDRLWVGEPGRLSLDDRDWWRPEEKLRLVCSTDDCFEIFLKSDFRRSCVSRLRLRLLLRAMRPLVTFFRAGPTLMDVFSSAVVRRAILLPLFSNSSTTSMCTSPRTDSPLMWVIRSPARRPASWAGLPVPTLTVL